MCALCTKVMKWVRITKSSEHRCILTPYGFGQLDLIKSQLDLLNGSHVTLVPVVPVAPRANIFVFLCLCPSNDYALLMTHWKTLLFGIRNSLFF
jgi:hypothetical protein